jgi:hypothetical protein
MPYGAHPTSIFGLRVENLNHTTEGRSNFCLLIA